MKTIISALLALSVLSGMAASALAAGDDLNCVGSSNIVQSLLSTTLSRRRPQTRSFTKNYGGYPMDRPRGFVTLRNQELVPLRHENGIAQRHQRASAAGRGPGRDRPEWSGASHRSCGCSTVLMSPLAAPSSSTARITTPSRHKSCGGALVWSCRCRISLPVQWLPTSPLDQLNAVKGSLHNRSLRCWIA